MKITLTDPGMHPLIKDYRNHYNMGYVFDLLAENNCTYTRAEVTIKDEDNNDVVLFIANRELGSKTWKCIFYSNLIDGSDSID